jgi:cytochrome c oxidase cbb3-type subunit IV
MDTVTLLRIAATLASFASFLGIMVWACSRRNSSAFEAASRLPFEEDGEGGEQR